MLEETAKRDLVLVPTDSTDEAAKADAGAALYWHNVAKTRIADRRPIGAKLVQASSGRVLGGLWGRTELGLLFLDLFFLDEEIRGRGYGAWLLKQVEDRAKARGCTRAIVETSSFQAPEFYARCGYEEFGRVPFGVAAHARIFLRKTLA